MSPFIIIIQVSNWNLLLPILGTQSSVTLSCPCNLICKKKTFCLVSWPQLTVFLAMQQFAYSNFEFPIPSPSLHMESLFSPKYQWGSEIRFSFFRVLVTVFRLFPREGTIEQETAQHLHFIASVAWLLFWLR